MHPTAPFENRKPISRSTIRSAPPEESSLSESWGDTPNGVDHVRRSRRIQSLDTIRPVHYQVTFSPESLPKVMLGIVLVLLSAHLLLSVYHFQVQKLPWLLRQLFDLDQENNLPSWYSGTALFVTTIFLWLCAREKRALTDPWSRQWYVLTGAFLFLAIDEIAGLHETFNSLIDVNWAIPGAVLASFFGLMLAPFLLGLRRKTAVLFGLSGIIYFGGAVGMELLASTLNSNSLRYTMMTLWEEGLEMLGVILFLYALLAYMGGEHRTKVRVAAALSSSQNAS